MPRLHVFVRSRTQAYAGVHLSSLHTVSTHLHPPPQAGPRRLLPPCLLWLFCSTLRDAGEPADIDHSPQSPPVPIFPSPHSWGSRSPLWCHICDDRKDRTLDRNNPSHTGDTHTAASSGLWPLSRKGDMCPTCQVLLGEERQLSE